jgi:hypothetical protein
MFIIHYIYPIVYHIVYHTIISYSLYPMKVSILYTTCAIPGGPFFFASLLTPPVFRSQEDRPIKVCNGKEEHHDETVEGPADVTKDCRCWSRRDFWMTKIFRFFFVVEQVET